MSYKSLLTSVLCWVIIGASMAQNTQIDSLKRLVSDTDDTLRQAYLYQELGHYYLSEQLDSSKYYVDLLESFRKKRIRPRPFGV